MRQHQSAAVLAGIGIIFLLTFVPTSAERNRLPAFDLPFAGGADAEQWLGAAWLDGGVPAAWGCGIAAAGAAALRDDLAGEEGDAGAGAAVKENALRGDT